MKIIDLLNKIANDEEVPKIIKYNDYVLYYEKDMKDYYDKEGNHPLLDTQCQFILNDEVEVIKDTPKEDKKIEKLESYISCGWNGTCKDFKREELYNDLKKIGKKINEIIKAINGE